MLSEKTIRAEEHIGLVYACIRNLFGLSEDAPLNVDEDLVQAGLLGLVKACSTYDPEKGSAFSSWAWLHIRRCVEDELSFRKRDRHIVRSEVRSNNKNDDDSVDLFNDVTLNGNGSDNDKNSSIESVENKIYLEQVKDVLLCFMKEHLNELEYRIIVLRYFEDKSVSETASLLGISEKRVYKLCNKALSKLRSHKKELEQLLNIDNLGSVDIKPKSRRLPNFWKRHKVSLREACDLVEELYQEIVSTRLEGAGFNTIKYVKFITCKDKKKKKSYMSVVLGCLQRLSETFSSVVFDRVTLERLLRDYINGLVDYYKEFLTFMHLNSDKFFEIFLRNIAQQAGSIERYCQIVQRGSVTNGKMHYRDSDIKLEHEDNGHNGLTRVI